MVDDIGASLWRRGLMREVSARLRDVSSPIELVNAGTTSDLPWLQIVYRLRDDNSALIGRILPLPEAVLAADGSVAEAPFEHAATILVAEVRRPLTTDQLAAITVDEAGVSWVEDASILEAPDGPSMRFVSSKEEFAEIFARTNPGTPFHF